MILTIENYPGSAHQAALESMFADRKAQFVDFFDWDVPVVDGRFEIDQFDTADAVYIISIDDGGRHEASLRMLPSWLPHLLGEIFPHLCIAGVPVGPTTWESTRLCLPSRHGAARRRELRSALISAMADFALARGLEHITGVIPEGFRREVLAMGWRAEPLGPALRIAGGPIGAFRIEVTSDICERLAWTGTYVGALELAA
ncbi:acyl-homoserine-lactone synthase [Novosphingobium album (ex Liu et al. 2023)]|uniref:Acyl-homoserine-lactone synthase n=1 Tax=Novosphingobium album (ex Liu et al. 2023) TaxID=3031130 RepID=A0ABT5WT95_9SPHN|nr:acyl-homoserine-lactone synthase [Novosphingobium album (ex Liu et al. 2023)]MDE8652468.1 acyl-homoserine-lactone synthase [Novosphingobium album (ex Liu et al. 2023)]